jgi:hypothetical protein
MWRRTYWGVRRYSDLKHATSALIISPVEQRAFILHLVRHVKCYNCNKLLRKQVVKCLKKWNKLSFNTHQSPICPREREFISGRLDIVKQRVYKIELLHPSSRDLHQFNQHYSSRRTPRGNSPPQVRWPLQQGKVFTYQIQCKKWTKVWVKGVAS